MDWIKVTPETMPNIEGCPFMLTVYSDEVIVRYSDGTVGTNRLRGQSDVTEIQEGKDKIRAIFVEWYDLKKVKEHGEITHWMPMPEPPED